MAVFLSIALAGNNVPTSGTVPGMGDYNCVSGGQSVSATLRRLISGCKFIHYIAAKGITSGCGERRLLPEPDGGPLADGGVRGEGDCHRSHPGFRHDSRPG